MVSSLSNSLFSTLTCLVMQGFIFSISFLTLKKSVEIIFQQKVNKRSSMKGSVINENEDELQTGNLVPSFNVNMQ